MKRVIILTILLAVALTATGCGRQGSAEPAKSSELVESTGSEDGADTAIDRKREVSTENQRGDELAAGSGDLWLDGLRQRCIDQGRTAQCDINSSDSDSSGEHLPAVQRIDIYHHICGGSGDSVDIALYADRPDQPNTEDKGDLSAKEVAYVKRNIIIDYIKWILSCVVILGVCLLFILKNNKKLCQKLIEKFNRVYDIYAGADGRMSKSEAVALIKDILTGELNNGRSDKN